METVFYSDTFNSVPTFMKVIIILGYIFMLIIIILLFVCIWFLFEKNKEEEEHDDEMNIDNYKDFLQEFKNKHRNNNNNSAETIKTDENRDEYPIMPKIKDLNGEYLKNLMTIVIN